MRIVTGRAILPCDGAAVPIPKAADAPVNANLPIAIRRAMAGAAQLRAFGQLEVSAVASAQMIQRARIMTIEAIVVSVVSAVAQDQIFVFVRQDDVVVRIPMHLDGLAFVVADVAVEAGSVAAGADQFSGGHAHGGGVRKARVER